MGPDVFYMKPEELREYFARFDAELKQVKVYAHRDFKKRDIIKGITIDEVGTVIAEDGISFKTLRNGDLQASICFLDVGYYANRMPVIQENLSNNLEVLIQQSFLKNELNFKSNDLTPCQYVKIDINKKGVIRHLGFGHGLFQRLYGYDFEKADIDIAKDKYNLGSDVARCFAAAEKYFDTSRSTRTGSEKFIETMMLFSRVLFAQYAIDKNLGVLFRGKTDENERHSIGIAPQLNYGFNDLPAADFGKPANNMVALYNQQYMDAYLERDYKSIRYLKNVVRKKMIEMYDNIIETGEVPLGQELTLIVGRGAGKIIPSEYKHLIDNSDIASDFINSSISVFANKMVSDGKEIEDVNTPGYREMISGLPVSQKDVVSTILALDGNRIEKRMAKAIALKIIEMNRNEDNEFSPNNIVKAIPKLYDVFRDVKTYVSYGFNKNNEIEVLKKHSLRSQKGGIVTTKSFFDFHDATECFLKSLSQQDIKIRPAVVYNNRIGRAETNFDLATENFAKFNGSREHLIEKYSGLGEEIESLFANKELKILNPVSPGFLKQEEVLLNLCKKYDWKMQASQISRGDGTMYQGARLKGDLFGDEFISCFLGKKEENIFNPYSPLIGYLKAMALVIEGKDKPFTEIKEIGKEVVPAESFVSKTLRPGTITNLHDWTCSF